MYLRPLVAVLVMDARRLSAAALLTKGMNSMDYLGTHSRDSYVPGRSRRC